jgi:pyridoxine 5-phosphate synthase
MRASRQRLYVNIDHVATVRQARRGADPDPVAAALLCEDAGADGITAHLREDRRHIQDRDVERLKQRLRTYFNLEMACTDEMVEIALQVGPQQVTLVPERREEITTEGGLDLAHDPDGVKRAIEKLRSAGIRTSLFIVPDVAMVHRARDLNADAVELHTGRFAHEPQTASTVTALRDASRIASGLGLAVHAGHGLTAVNVAPVAAIDEVEELNVGHSLVSRALFVGLPTAIKELRVAMDDARIQTQTRL